MLKCAYNQRYNLQQKSFPLRHSIFTSLFYPYIFTKSSLQSPLTIPLYRSNFSPPSFCIQPSQQSTQKIFSLLQPFSQFKLRQGTRELRSLVGSLVGRLMRIGTVLISPFFLKVWTVIQGSQSLIGSGKKNWYIAGVANHPIHLLSYPQPIAIISILY